MRRLPNENGKKTYLAHGKVDFFGEVELAHSGCRGPGSDRSPVLLQPVAGCMKNVGHYTSNRFDGRYGERYGLGSRTAKQPSPAVFRFCFSESLRESLSSKRPRVDGPVHTA